MDDEAIDVLTEMALLIGLTVAVTGGRTLLEVGLDRLFPVDPATGSSGSTPADLVRQQMAKHADLLLELEALRRRGMQ